MESLHELAALLAAGAQKLQDEAKARLVTLPVVYYPVHEISYDDAAVYEWGHYHYWNMGGSWGENQLYRWVWETAFGTPPGWHIHHIDGNSTNNLITNLMAVNPGVHRMLHFGMSRQPFRQLPDLPRSRFTLRNWRECLAVDLAPDAWGKRGPDGVVYSHYRLPTGTALPKYGAVLVGKRTYSDVRCGIRLVAGTIVAYPNDRHVFTPVQITAPEKLGGVIPFTADDDWCWLERCSVQALYRPCHELPDTAVVLTDDF